MVEQWLKCRATNRKVAGSIPASVSGFFVDIKSFQSHYGPGVDSTSNRNEYQEYFLGVNPPVRKADNLPPPCAVVTKSGSRNFLEPSGPVQACNGTAYQMYVYLPQNYTLHSIMCVQMQFLGNYSFMTEQLLSSSESKEHNLHLPSKIQCKGIPVQAYYWPRQFQAVEVPRFLDNQHMTW